MNDRLSAWQKRKSHNNVYEMGTGSPLSSSTQSADG
jgi:hypothetical protein